MMRMHGKRKNQTLLKCGEESKRLFVCLFSLHEIDIYFGLRDDEPTFAILETYHLDFFNFIACFSTLYMLHAT